MPAEDMRANFRPCRQSIGDETAEPGGKWRSQFVAGSCLISESIANARPGWRRVRHLLAGLSDRTG